MLAVAAAIVLCALGLLVAGVCLQSYLEWRTLSSMPHPATSSTSFAGSVELLRDTEHMAHVFAAASESLGSAIYSMRVFHVNTVVVTDPAIVARALILPKDKRIYTIFNSLTSPGGHQPNILGHFTHDGYWKLVRKGVAPAFSPKNIRAEFPHLLNVVDRLSELISRAGSERVIDIDSALQRESMEVIGRIGFGHDFNAIERFEDSDGGSSSGDGSERLSNVAHDVFGVLKCASKEIAKRWSTPFRYRLRHVLPDARRGETHLAALQAQFRTLLEAVRSRGPPSEDDTSIAAHLLRIRDPDTGKPLSDEQLAAEMGLFLFGGYETTGHTMAWVLFMLARHPAVQAKVEAELDAHGLLVTPQRPSPRSLQYQDLSGLQYMGAAIKETMRLVPVVAGGTARSSPTPIRLGGYTIPANVTVVLLLYGLHHSSRNWERPEEFDPERWMQPGTEYWQGAVGNAPAHGMSSDGSRDGLLTDVDQDETGQCPRRFLPFSGGPRSCIGQNLAAMNYTATLAVLLSRFLFKLPEELMSETALWELQRNRITNQPGWKDGEGLPMRCIPRAA